MITRKAGVTKVQGGKTNFSKKRRKDLIFCCCLMALPLLQYLIFYIGVNFNSILLSLQEYVIVGNGYEYKLSGFQNFKAVIHDLTKETVMLTAIKNSAIAYLVSLCITTPLALIFSFYIIKKLRGAKLFRVVLFLPTIICSVILLYMFRVVADNIIPDIVELCIGDTEGFKKANYQLLAQDDLRFKTIIIYHIFVGFGVNVLMYSGAMSGVSTEIIESANLDGAGDFKEFWYIVLPSVWPTLTTFIVVGVTGFFTNQLDLYSLYGTNANSNIWTLGYYMFRYTVADDTRYELYPYLSAMGIVFTFIAVPVTLAVKKLLERLGPSAE